MDFFFQCLLSFEAALVSVTGLATATLPIISIKLTNGRETANMVISQDGANFSSNTKLTKIITNMIYNTVCLGRGIINLK